MYVCTEYMEVVRHVVNDMSCWTIVEHVYGTTVQRFIHHGLHQVQK